MHSEINAGPTGNYLLDRLGVDTSGADTSAQPPAPAQTPASAAATAHATPPDDTFEARYKSLVGKYNAETQRMSEIQRDNAEMSSQMNALREEIANMRAENVRQQASTPYALSHEDQQYLDGNTAGVVQRMVDQRIQPLVTEIVELRKALAYNATPAARHTEPAREPSGGDEFVQQVQQYVPNWNRIYESPEFRRWMAQTGNDYELNAAANAKDVAKVVRIFNAFLASGSAAQSDSRGPSLEAQAAAPGPSAPAPPQTPGAPRMSALEYQEEMRQLNMMDPGPAADRRRAELKAVALGFLAR